MTLQPRFLKSPTKTAAKKKVSHHDLRMEMLVMFRGQAVNNGLFAAPFSLARMRSRRVEMSNTPGVHFLRKGVRPN